MVRHDGDTQPPGRSEPFRRVRFGPNLLRLEAEIPDALLSEIPLLRPPAGSGRASSR
jgi:hypothetical protein